MSIVTIVCAPRRSGTSTLLKQLGCEEVGLPRWQPRVYSNNKGFETTGEFPLDEREMKLLNEADEIHLYWKGDLKDVMLGRLDSSITNKITKTGEL